jgi:hypothetical protein
MELIGKIGVMTVRPEKISQDRSAQANRQNCIYSDVFRRFVMSIIRNVAARLLAVSALATLSFATVANAQMYGQGPGPGGGMMGGNWGWGMGYGGMGGFGGIAVLVLVLGAVGIAVMAFRRRSP